LTSGKDSYKCKGLETNLAEIHLKLEKAEKLIGALLQIEELSTEQVNTFVDAAAKVKNLTTEKSKLVTDFIEALTEDEKKKEISEECDKLVNSSQNAKTISLKKQHRQ
jgi:ferritin